MEVSTWSLLVWCSFFSLVHVCLRSLTFFFRPESHTWRTLRVNSTRFHTKRKNKDLRYSVGWIITMNHEQDPGYLFYSTFILQWHKNSSMAWLQVVTNARSVITTEGVPTIATQCGGIFCSQYTYTWVSFWDKSLMFIYLDMGIVRRPQMMWMNSSQQLLTMVFSKNSCHAKIHKKIKLWNTITDGCSKPNNNERKTE